MVHEVVYVDDDLDEMKDVLNEVISMKQIHHRREKELTAMIQLNTSMKMKMFHALRVRVYQCELISVEEWGGRYQPTLEMPIGHITRPCAITNQPNN